MNRTRVRGLVVDHEGEGVAGAHVVVVDSSVPMPELALVTDAHGAFELNLPPGVYRLRAERGAGSAETDVQVPGSNRITIVLRSVR